METKEKIKMFLESDLENVQNLIDEHSTQISVLDVAKFLGTTADSVRSAVESGVFGMAWKKPGVSNRGFFIPTAQFVRWYLTEKGLKNL